MIFTHAQTAAILADRDILIGLVPTRDERERLRELGLRPFVDDLLEAFVTGKDLDTSSADVHRAAVKAVLEGERGSIGGEGPE